MKLTEPEKQGVRTANIPDSTNLSEAIKQYDIPSRMAPDGVKVPLSPVFLVDLAANPVRSGSAVAIKDATTQLSAQVQQAASDSSGATNSLVTRANQNLFNIVSGQWENARTATAFKNITTLANGSTAIWTSGVGKKWRLMGVSITLMQGTTAAGACKVSLLDVAADTGIGYTICIAAMTAVLNATNILSISFGNGILAAATNTALNVNLSSVLAVGGVSVQVWGTEE